MNDMRGKAKTGCWLLSLAARRGVCASPSSLAVMVYRQPYRQQPPSHPPPSPWFARLFPCRFFHSTNHESDIPEEEEEEKFEHNKQYIPWTNAMRSWCMRVWFQGHEPGLSALIIPRVENQQDQVQHPKQHPLVSRSRAPRQLPYLMPQQPQRQPR